MKEGGKGWVRYGRRVRMEALREEICGQNKNHGAKQPGAQPREQKGSFLGYMSQVFP